MFEFICTDLKNYHFLLNLNILRIRLTLILVGYGYNLQLKVSQKIIMESPLFSHRVFIYLEFINIVRRMPIITTIFKALSLVFKVETTNLMKHN